MKIISILCFLLACSPCLLAKEDRIKDFYDLSTKERVLAISFKGSDSIKEFLSQEMAPLGSAVLTGSGELDKKGVTGIIHAASGSMSKSQGIFKPSIDGVELSLSNAVRIAEKRGFKSIAIPFIGSGIFLSRIGVSKEALAGKILESSATSEVVAPVIVAYSDDDLRIFQKALKKLDTKKASKIKILKGSITDFSLHKSPAIVNAANTELVFGGGISGFIGRSSGEADKINRDGKKIIEFLKSKYGL